MSVLVTVLQLAPVLVTFPCELTWRQPSPVETNRFVVEAVVAKKLVVVAAVPVAFWKVKFWRVEEAVAKRLLKVPKPEAVKLPVKLAVELIV